jgi:pyridoxine kinase
MASPPVPPTFTARSKATKIVILSIQSWVTYGHVGNASALFPLQRLGAEVWAINSVQFSNHPGYGAFTGEAVSPETVRALVDGVAARGVLGQCDAVLSGYIGQAGIGESILYAVAKVRAENPASLYCCDPVIGDIGPGVYVRPGVPEFFRHQAVAAADLLTPNAFELGQLTGLPCATLDEAKAAAVLLRARMHAGGPRAILVTSLELGDSIGLLLASDDGFHLLRTDRIPVAFNGAGDAIAALFLFHVRAGLAPVHAAELAASSIGGLLRATFAAGSQELCIVAAQDEFVAPSLTLSAEAL